jgi:hypothetical protein
VIDAHPKGMASHRPAQVNIRSDVVKRRIREVTARTGMTATQFLEQAVLAYDPVQPPERRGRLVRKGKFWAVSTGGRSVSLEEINASIEADRSRGDTED